MTKNDDKCVPALRFKGFNNDWAQRMLGEISIVNSGKDYKQLNKGNILKLPTCKSGLVP